MPRGLMRARLLRCGMGLFLLAAALTAANVLLLPFARACYGYGAGPAFASFALALGAFLLLGRALARADEGRLERAVRTALPAFLAALFALQLLLGYLMAYTPSWDNHMLVDGARLLASGAGFADGPDYALYFSRFSNQWGFLLILTGLFRLFAAAGVTDFLFGLVVLQAALYTLGLLAAADIARRLRGARGVLALLALLAACLPLYLAAAVLYTDTFSLPFILLTLRFALCAQQAKAARARVGYALAAAMTAACGAQIKMTVLIALLAAGIVWTLRLRAREALCCCALSVAAAVSLAALTQGVMTARVLDGRAVFQHRVPAVHWVMMSIPSQSNPYGSYYGEDYLETWTLMRKGASREEIRASIYSRMRDKLYALRDPRRFALAALAKNAGAMGDGTFGMTEMLDDGPVRENAVSSFVLEGRPFYGLYSAVCSGIYLAALTLAAAGCAGDIRRRDERAAVLYVAALGIMLFLMLWEARSRYLFGFVPVVLLLGAGGIARENKDIKI